jgi:SAM-dependent methyltransferase
MSVVTLACPLCGSGLRRSQRPRARLDLQECTDCGHVVASVMTSSAVAADAEALQHAHFGDAFAAADDRWTRLVDRANARRVRRLLEGVLRPSARILEVGPGRGAVLLELATAGFQAEGLELSSAVAELSRRRSGVPVAMGTLERHADSVSFRYEAVVVRHVLEHMADPTSAVATISRLLAPGGAVYVAVPNIGAPEAALAGWTGYQPYHLHYFTPPRLRALFERHGFVVTRLRTREPFSGWFNAVVGSLRRGGRGDAAAAGSRPAGTMVGIYNAARLCVGALLAPARLIQAVAGYGEEIELLARKPAGA